MAKKKLTPNQQLFKKEQQRIKRFIKSAEKRGYKFEKDLIPQMPTRVSKQDLYNIKKLTPEILYRHSTSWYNHKTLSGTERRKLERKVSAQKAKITKEIRETFYTGISDEPYTPILSPDRVIQDWFNRFSNFPNGVAVPMLQQWFLGVMEQLKNKFGEDIAKQMLATMVKDSVDNIGYITWSEAYSPEKAQAYISKAVTYIPFLGADEMEEFEEMFDQFTGDDYLI